MMNDEGGMMNDEGGILLVIQGAFGRFVGLAEVPFKRKKRR
jgi:hypothetical protein